MKVDCCSLDVSESDCCTAAVRAVGDGVVLSDVPWRWGMVGDSACRALPPLGLCGRQRGEVGEGGEGGRGTLRWAEAAGERGRAQRSCGHAQLSSAPLGSAQLLCLSLSSSKQAAFQLSSVCLASPRFLSRLCLHRALLN